MFGSIGLLVTNSVFPWRSPLSIFSAPAPIPKPTPLGPNFLAWQVLQKRVLSCSEQLVESNILLHMAKYVMIYESVFCYKCNKNTYNIWSRFYAICIHPPIFLLLHTQICHKLDILALLQVWKALRWVIDYEILN